LDILGAFLLSVEAIKIENVNKLAKRLFDTANEFIPGLPHKQLGWAGSSVFLMVLVTMFIFVGWAIIYYAPQEFAFAYLIAAVAVSLFLLIPIVIVISFILTGFISIPLALLVGLMSGALGSIERNVPSGIIGLIGFALLVLGFLGQMVGTLVGAPS
jgi:hypothetical protein